jgi:hypothetical protein
MEADPPDFGTGLTMLETQKNLIWLPSITNVPMFPNLSVPIRAPPVGRTPGSSPPVRTLPPLLVQKPTMYQPRPAELPMSPQSRVMIKFVPSGTLPEPRCSQ